MIQAGDRPVAPVWSSAGFDSERPEEFFRVPVLWIHGHTHQSFDSRWGTAVLYAIRAAMWRGPEGWRTGSSRRDL